MAEGEELNLEKPAREITRGIFKGIWDWICSRDQRSNITEESRRGILIIGPGGSGKTTLARLMSGECDWFDTPASKYVESSDLERVSLKDDPDVEAVVAPGQEYRRASTWPELLGQVGAGCYRGVILVNAWGYETFSTPSYKSHKLFKGKKDQFLTDYFADRRADELRILRDLAPHLSTNKQRVWLLSIVSKQDLWGSQQRDVEQHYRDGDYGKTVQSITDSLGSRIFRHEAVFVSLTIRNLETIAGERLLATEAGYDITRLAESMDRLARVLNALRNWEGET